MRKMFLQVASVATLSCLFSTTSHAAPIPSQINLSGIVGYFTGNSGVLNSSSAPAASGESVGTWQNQVAGGPNVTSDTGVVPAPIFNTNGLNGHPSLAFNNSVLDNLTTNLLPTNSSRTVFVVAVSPSGAGGDFITNGLIHQNDVEQRSAPYVYSDGATVNLLTGASTPTTAFIDAHIEDRSTLPSASGTLTTVLNGTVDSSSTGVANENTGAGSGNQGFVIGNRLDYGQTQNFVGNIATVLVYDRVLSLAEINQVDTYLGGSYGITTAIVTPEPSAFVLCGLGALGLLIAARRRCKA